MSDAAKIEQPNLTVHFNLVTNKEEEYAHAYAATLTREATRKKQTKKFYELYEAAEAAEAAMNNNEMQMKNLNEDRK